MGKFLAAVFIGLVVVITKTASPQAATIYVPLNYKTINEAVKNALPKDIIIVSAGNYTENIVITKPLTIKSSKGADTSIVHALAHSEPVFKISNASDVSITGLGITGSLVSGVYLYAANNVKITGNKLTENGSGIILYSSNGNTLSNNEAVANKQYGIYLESSNGNTLEKNTLTLNKDKGIFLSSSSFNKLINNDVNLNAWDGIILWSSHNNILEGNKVYRNRYGITLSESNNNTLTNNSQWSNIYVILPAVLVYIGIIVYLIQKTLIHFIYRDKE